MRQQTEKYLQMEQRVGFSRVMLDEAVNYDRVLKEKFILDRAKIKSDKKRHSKML